MIELLNEDCMNVMARYPDKHFDLAVVDPPYGIFGVGGVNLTPSDGLKKKSKREQVEHGRVNTETNLLIGIMHRKKNISMNF